MKGRRNVPEAPQPLPSRQKLAGPSGRCLAGRSIMLAFASTSETEPRALHNHLVETVREAPLEREPFCHIYMEGILPAAVYPAMLRNLPPAALYQPLNLRKWVRADGTSTRDQFHLTAE